jgi:integrase
MHLPKLIAPRKATRIPWNKGHLVGQKPPLTLKEVWSIRSYLQLDESIRDLALFNLAIDSKLRACDLVQIALSDITTGSAIRSRAVIRQQKTDSIVRFEITDQTKTALSDWINHSNLTSQDYLFPSKSKKDDHLSTRQYSRIAARWFTSIGLDKCVYGTHSLRRTKAAYIYRKTGNIRAVQLLLGHKKLESTVRYLGIDVEDALTISEKIEF